MKQHPQEHPIELERRPREEGMPDWRLTTRGRRAAVVLFVVVSGVLGWYVYDISNWVWGR